MASKEETLGAIAVLQGSGSLLESIYQQLVGYLLTGWGIVILVGTFGSALLIALGLIYWFSGIGTQRGRKMLIGGIILFLAMQWLALNPPWSLILGLISS